MQKILPKRLKVNFRKISCTGALVTDGNNIINFLNKKKKKKGKKGKCRQCTESSQKERKKERKRAKSKSKAAVQRGEKRGGEYRTQKVSFIQSPPPPPPK